jgi:hypothetical protein
MQEKSFFPLSSEPSRQCPLSKCDWARLVGALLGGAIAASLAVVLACVIFPPGGAYDPEYVGALEITKAWGRQEDREKAFYVLTLFLGPSLGWLAARAEIAGRRPTAASLVLLLVTVPALSKVIGIALASSGIVAAAYGLSAAAVLTIAALIVRRGGHESGSSALPATAALAEHVKRERHWRPMLFGAVAMLVIVIVLVPISARSVAAAIGFDMHMASFMVGPATYTFGRALVPGIDYFTQYSVGTPWVFSFFLAQTASETMVHAVWFVIAEMLFFELTLFWFLWWLLRGWGWALVMSLAILMMQFTTSNPLYAPSSTSARYPLMILVAGLFACWVRKRLLLSMTVMLSLSLACALFLNTETGIYISAAVAIATVLAVPPLLRSVGSVALLGVLTFVFFALLSLVAFGSGVLDLRYFYYLLEPLVLYTSGLGAWPIEWIGGLHWLYNIVSPGMAIATVGWVAVVARQSVPPVDRSRLAALAMISLIGLFLTAKFINMSIVALWQVSSVGLLIVLAWWARSLLDSLDRRSVMLGRLDARTAATTGVWGLLAAFLFMIDDPRNPSLYAVMSYRTHPTVVNAVLGGLAVYGCSEDRTGCTAAPVAPDDVKLLTRLTQSGERVALLMLQDWTYLIEARRPSKFYFLPSAVLFTRRQLTESLRDTHLIFLPREPASTLGINHPSILPILLPLLREKFEVVDGSPGLLAWRNVRK